MDLSWNLEKKSQQQPSNRDKVNKIGQLLLNRALYISELENVLFRRAGELT